MGDLLAKLGIDWRLLIAQLVNVIILFVLLQRFLYHPALSFLVQRRERIAKGIADAEAAARKLHDVELERQAILERAEVERRSLLEAAAEAAEALRRQRVEAAEGAAAALMARSRTEAERERGEVIAGARRAIAELVLDVTRRVTAKELPPTVHAALAAAAVEELRTAVR